MMLVGDAAAATTMKHVVAPAKRVSTPERKRRVKRVDWIERF